MRPALLVPLATRRSQVSTQTNLSLKKAEPKTLFNPETEKHLCLLVSCCVHRLVMLVRTEASTIVTGHGPANLAPCEAACACPIAARSETPSPPLAKTRHRPATSTWFQKGRGSNIMAFLHSCEKFQAVTAGIIWATRASNVQTPHL